MASNGLQEQRVNLSTRSDYAVRLVLELAAIPSGTLLHMAELSRRAGVPDLYAVEILRTLRTHGIVRTARGIHGGFALRGDPARLTVGEVVRLDGPLGPTQCANGLSRAGCRSAPCRAQELCVLQHFWSEVREVIAAVLDGTTFADLVAKRRANGWEPSVTSPAPDSPPATRAD